MTDIQFNPHPNRTGNQPTDAVELTEVELAEREQKRLFLQEKAHDIILAAQQHSNTALHCLHKVSVLGGTTEKAYRAIYQRIIQDNDAYAAYHAVAMAQTTADLPFDVGVLMDIIIRSNDAQLLLRTAKLFVNQPLTAPPLPSLKDAIMQHADDDVIAEFVRYFADYH